MGTLLFPCSLHRFCATQTTHAQFIPLPSPPIANLGRLIERYTLYVFLLKWKVIEAAHSGKLTLGKGNQLKI